MVGGKKKEAVALLRCAPWMGMAEDGAARKRDRMQARRSWNQFKWYHSAPPFFPSSPPPFSSPTPSASQPRSSFLSHSLSLAYSTVLSSAEGEGKGGVLMVARSTALLCTVTSLLFTHLRALFLHQLYFKETSGAAAHTGKVGCWRVSLF